MKTRQKILPKTYSRRRRGFTLLEILATFVLIAIIIPVAMGGLSLAMKMAGQSRDQVQACCLAETKLTELLVTEDYLNGNQSGNFGPDWPEYQWHTEIRDWTEATLKQLDLYVQWDRRQMTHTIGLTTLVYVQEPTEIP